MSEFKGRLADGKTAAARDVRVRIDRALEMWAPVADKPEIWALHRLESAAPLRRNGDDALLRSKDHPGATLFVSGPGVARALLAAAPQLSNARVQWGYLRPLLVAAAAIAAIIGVVYIFDLSPAKAIARLLPDGFRTRVGDNVAASLAGPHRVCGRADGIAALDKLTRRLSAATSTDIPYRLKVVEWDLVNAFAVPGEQIVVSRGLIDEAKSADEVAGVIAHEMGHGLERHPEAGVVRAMGISLAMELFFSGSSGTLGNLGAMLLQLRYSREAEREADAHAIAILKNSAISSVPLGDFFKRLQEKEGSSGGEAATAAIIFSTHPPSADRAKLAEQAGTYVATPSMTESEWQALRGICKEG